MGLQDGKEYTHAEIGKMYGIGRQRVMQIESKALRQLRHPLRARKLLAFMADGAEAGVEEPEDD